MGKMFNRESNLGWFPGSAKPSSPPPKSSPPPRAAPQIAECVQFQQGHYAAAEALALAQSSLQAAVQQRDRLLVDLERCAAPPPPPNEL